MISMDVNELKRMATGRWPEILSALGGIDQTLLDGRHHACPQCAGRDRFSLAYPEDGGIRCNNCFDSRNRDGFDALRWARGWDFAEAKQRVADYLGAAPAPANGNHPKIGKAERKSPADLLAQIEIINDPTALAEAVEQWCQAKPGVRPHGVMPFAPSLCWWPRNGRGRHKCLAVHGRDTREPEAIASIKLFRVDGKMFPATDKLAERKTHTIGGSRNAWLWAGSIDDLRAATTIVKPEGEPDVFSLQSQELPPGWAVLTNTNGCGAVGRLDFSFVAGKRAPVFPDSDRPGMEGAQKFAAKFLEAGATAAPVVALPFEVSETHGADLRDWLAAGNGIDELRGLMNAARESEPQIATPIDHDESEAPFENDAESDYQSDNPITTGSLPWSERYREGVEKHGTGLNGRRGQLSEKEAKEVPLRYVPFPVDLFRRPVRKFIEDVAKAVRVDPVLVVQPTLAVLSTAIGGSVQFSPKRGWYEPAALWTLTLSESGSGKSPAASPPIKILKRIQSESFRKHKGEMARHNQELMAYEVAKRNWQSGGSKRGEPAPEKPDEPACHRLITSDCTMEKLAVILNENERGLMVWRDEWSGWLKSFDQYKSKGGGDLGHWLSIWSGESFYVDRKVLGRLPIFVSSPFCALHGGCQPDIWSRLLRNGELTECGLVARFLVAMPPRRSQRWSEDDISDSVTDAMKTVVTNLLSIRLEHDENDEPKPRALKLTTEAKDHFAAWHDRLAEEQERLSGGLAMFFSKLKGMAVRLAGVQQLTSWACEPDARDDHIDLESIEVGCRMADWFAHEAKRVDAAIHETPEARDRRLLLEKIQTMGGRTSIRNLCRHHGRLMGKAEQAEKELLVIQGMKLGAFEVTEPGPEGGQPKREFVLFSENPSDTTHENDGENEVVSVSMPNREAESGPTKGTVTSEEGGATWIDMTI